MVRIERAGSGRDDRPEIGLGPRDGLGERGAEVKRAGPRLCAKRLCEEVGKRSSPNEVVALTYPPPVHLLAADGGERDPRDPADGGGEALRVTCFDNQHPPGGREALPETGKRRVPTQIAIEEPVLAGDIQEGGVPGVDAGGQPSGRMPQEPGIEVVADEEDVVGRPSSVEEERQHARRVDVRDREVGVAAVERVVLDENGPTRRRSRGRARTRVPREHDGKEKNPPGNPPPHSSVCFWRHPGNPSYRSEASRVCRSSASASPPGAVQACRGSLDTLTRY